MTNEITKPDYDKMTKAELLTVIEELSTKLENRKGDGRKEEVLAILKREPMTIYDISEELGISNKNVSSQLCYLKKDGIQIASDPEGRKFLWDFDYKAAGITLESDLEKTEDGELKDEAAE